ncbi:MAG: SusC/RagA family TonB-linked outer membrane protein [Chitinophagaceae bacterium]|nr:SusC/RagA family TonB-linked outer membrane protein [Chitinophagaceae bacterium]
MKKRLLLTLTVLLLGLQVVLAQSGALKGRITDDKGEPIPGATIRVKGTSKGTVTDMNGNFKINVDDGAMLQISAIGMKTTEKPAQDGMNVKLASETRGIGEVVVTAMAVPREKRSLGYSTTQIKGDDLTQGQDRSALSALAGKVAGVNITNTSGSPGSGTRVVIRGGSSITGDNQALIVVDGVPYNNGNSQNAGDNLNNQLDAGNRGNDINPEDIESMTVLKGAVASALYGSRASNGAIMITTKKGKGGKGGAAKNASFSSNYGWSNILKYPEFQNDWGQGYGGETHTEENWSWGRKFDGKLAPWGNVVNGVQKVKPYVALPDNVKDFFRRGKTWDNNFNIGGSNEKSNYFVSFSNLSNQGIVENSDYRRTSVRFNGGTIFNDKLSAQIGANYTKVKANLFAQGQANNSFYDQIYQTPRDIPMRELRDLNDPFNTLEGYYGAYTINPYYVVENYKNLNNVDRLTGNIDLNYKPFKWLEVINRTTNDYYTDITTQYAPKFNVVREDFGVDINEPGQYSVSNLSFNEINNDLMFRIKQSLAKDFSINALLGHNVRQRSSRSSYAETKGTVINDFQNLDNTASGHNAASARFLSRWVGLYADVQFNFSDYLFLNLTGRNDWSSNLPINKNSYFYPGASLAFVISDLLQKEANLNDKYLSFAKLRMGITRVGADGSSNYALYPTFAKNYITDGYNNSELLFPINGVAAYSQNNRLENPNLKPEITVEKEIGTELGFFQDRLRVDLSLYDRTSKDMIIPVDLPASSGYTSGLFNAGKITNRGIELAVNATPVRMKNNGLKWDLFFTYTKNKSEVKELFGDNQQLSLGGFNGLSVVAAVGQPYGAIYTRGPERTASGQIICDANGMPILSSTPQLYGSYNPDWMASWGTDLSFKGFRAHVLFFHKQGGQIYSRLKNIMEFVGSSSTTAYNDREDFVVPNSVVEVSPGVYATNETKVNAETFWTEQSNNEMNILPATFTKLREASLSYSLPKKWMKKSPFGSIEVGVYGNNLCLWVSREKNEFGQRKNTFIDPEINGFGTGNVQGVEFGTVPSLRNYGVNLRLTF